MARTRYFVLSATALTALAVLGSAQAGADQRCFGVTGGYVERPALGPDCSSPVGLCFEGDFHGSFRGTFAGQATTIVPTADTPATSALLFTGDSTFDVSMRGRSGTLHVKNAGSFATTGAGDIVDLQTIIGGTGDFAGATGFVRASGTFTIPAGGKSEYTGSVCLP